MPHDTEILIAPRVRFLCGIPVGIGFIFLIFSVGDMFSGFWIEDVAALLCILMAIGFFGWIGWRGKLPAVATTKPEITETSGT